MKPGDAIWTRQTVHHAAHHKPDDVWFGNPVTMQVTYCPADNYMPDVAALPQLAKWLAEHGPESLLVICWAAHPALVQHIGSHGNEQIRAIYDGLIQLGAALRPWESVAEGIKAALTPEAGDGAREGTG